MVVSVLIVRDCGVISHCSVIFFLVFDSFDVLTKFHPLGIIGDVSWSYAFLCWQRCSQARALSLRVRDKVGLLAWLSELERVLQDGKERRRGEDVDSSPSLLLNPLQSLMLESIFITILLTAGGIDGFLREDISENMTPTLFKGLTGRCDYL
ncbi:UNVERIFIED_CONTAM: hypothetical protein Slati_1845900 [Sesamum latifolium]|uniref:Uncharacterized protein n=1 Tax=Sesamum latifolium TaxID=2727402 RepID=A0AAW2X4F8_9LAMI